MKSWDRVVLKRYLVNKIWALYKEYVVASALQNVPIEDACKECDDLKKACYILTFADFAAAYHESATFRSAVEKMRQVYRGDLPPIQGEPNIRSLESVKVDIVKSYDMYNDSEFLRAIGHEASQFRDVAFKQRSNQESQNGTHSTWTSMTWTRKEQEKYHPT